MLVEINFTKPLIRGKMINLQGKRSFIQFKYERIPRLCFRCGLLSHGTNWYSQKPLDGFDGDASRLQYGSWLRATNSVSFMGLNIFVSTVPQGSCPSVDVGKKAVIDDMHENINCSG